MANRPTPEPVDIAAAGPNAGAPGVGNVNPDDLDGGQHHVRTAYRSDRFVVGDVVITGDGVLDGENKPTTVSKTQAVDLVRSATENGVRVLVEPAQEGR